MTYIYKWQEVFVKSVAGKDFVELLQEINNQWRALYQHRDDPDKSAWKRAHVEEMMHNNINELLGRITELNKDNHDLAKALGESSKLVDSLNNDVELLKKDNKDLKDKLSSANKEIKKLKEQLKKSE